MAYSHWNYLGTKEFSNGTIVAVVDAGGRDPVHYDSANLAQAIQNFQARGDVPGALLDAARGLAAAERAAAQRAGDKENER